MVGILVRRVLALCVSQGTLAAVMGIFMSVAVGVTLLSVVVIVVVGHLVLCVGVVCMSVSARVMFVLGGSCALDMIAGHLRLWPCH